MWKVIGFLTLSGAVTLRNAVSLSSGTTIGNMEVVLIHSVPRPTIGVSIDSYRQRVLALETNCSFSPLKVGTRFDYPAYALPPRLTRAERLPRRNVLKYGSDRACVEAPTTQAERRLLAAGVRPKAQR